MTEVSHQPFSRSLLLGLFMAASLAMAGGGYHFYHRQVIGIRADRYEDLKVINQLKIAQLVAWRGERLADARVVSTGAARVETLRWLNAPNDPELAKATRDRLQALVDNYGYKNVILAAPDGRMLYSLEPRLTELELAAKELVAHVVATREASFGELFRCGVCGQVHLDVAALVGDASGRTVAVLILRTDPERHVYPLIQSWPTSSASAETLLVARVGDDVLFLNSLRHGSDRALTLRRPLADADLPAAKAVQGLTGLAEGKDYRGIEVVADLRPVPGTSWFMVAKVDASELYAEARYRGVVIVIFVALGILMAALALGFVFYLARASFYHDLFRATRIGPGVDATVPEQRARLARTLAMAAACSTVALGLAVLAGWLFDIPSLKSVLPGFVTMKANTAAGLVLAGAALALLLPAASTVARRSSLGLALGAALLGVVTFSQYAFGVDLGVDQLLFVEPAGAVGTLSPGRMAPATAITFIILGAAIALAGFRRAVPAAQRLALLSGVMGLLPLIGYLYGATSLYGIANYTRMAVHTAVAFVVLGAAVCLARPADGLMRTLTANTLGGWLVRRLAPLVLVVPLVLGWLRVEGERNGLFEGTLGVALMMVTIIILFAATLWWAASALTEIDAVRRRAESRALESAEEVRATLYGIGDGVVTTDALGRVTRMNPVAELLTGWTEAEGTGRPLAEVFNIVNEETRAAVETPVARVLREGRVVGLANHTALIARDGTARPIADSGAPIRLGQGQIRGVVLVFRDQTAERAARAAVAQADANFVAAFQRSPVSIGIVSIATDKYVDVNDTFLRNSGFARDEVVGHTAAELNLLVDPADRQRVLDRVHAAGEAHDVEVVLRMKSGELRTGLASVTVILLAGEQHLLTTVVDISERKRAEAEAQTRLVETKRLLEVAEQSRRALLSMMEDQKLGERRRQELESQLNQAQKMESIGRLAGGVAHDFNNLLSVILSYTGFAVESARDHETLKADLLEVNKAAERAVGLTRQLLAFSRKQVLQPVLLDLNQVVLGVEKMLRRILGEDIDFVRTLAPGVGLILADPGQIEQVLMNLVVNARDAMPKGGKLTVGTANVEVDEDYAASHVSVTPGSYVQVSVTDTGCGMDEQIKARLFEPFFTTKEKGKGTGLGLSTVYGIVKQSGGNIWVYSEPGKGTTFKIYLPRDLTATQATAIERQTTPQRITGTETILVVEDEEALRKVATRALAAAGYTVLTAGDGDEALVVSARHSGDIHLLLTDVIMPHMSGKVLADRVATVRPATRVLYMSGYADDAIVRHGVLDPGTRFIGKPFTAADLTRKVREVLDDTRNVSSAKPSEN